MRRPTLAILALAAAPLPANAQAGMDWMTPTIEGQRFSDLVRYNDRVRAGGPGRPAAAPRTATTTTARPAAAARPAAVSPARTAIRSTPASQKASLAAYVARVSRSQPHYAAEASRMFAQHDAFQVYDTLIASSGLRGDDAADVLASYMLLGYEIASGGEATPAQARGVRRQLAERIAASPALAALPVRTGMAEELKLTFVTLHAGYKSAHGEGTVDEYRTGVARFFAGQGTDFSRLRLSDEGFVGA